MQILVCQYFLQILDFLVTGIFLEDRIIYFSGNLSTGTDLAINFDFLKCITKNKYRQLSNCNGKVGRWGVRTFTKKVKCRHQTDVFSWCIQETLKLLDVMQHKVTQYIHQPTRQLYSISAPKVLYRQEQVPVKIKEKLMIYVVWLFILCFIQCQFVFLWQIVNYYSTVSSCFVCILTEKEKKVTIIL